MTKKKAKVLTEEFLVEQLQVNKNFVIEQLQVNKNFVAEQLQINKNFVVEQLQINKNFVAEQLQLIRKDLTQQLQSQKDFFFEYLHEQLRTQSIFMEARIEAARQDFRDHIGSVQKQLNTRMDHFDKKMDYFEKSMDGFHSELKTTQLAIRTVKEDTVRIEHKLTRITEDHEVRITRLEANA